MMGATMDDKALAMQACPVPTALPFRCVLKPHRSLSKRGFMIFMGVICGLSFIAGIVFLALGAWPVMGFFGLDVALVYLAFKLNYRAARAVEMIEVTRDELIVTRISANGRQRAETRLSPTWARLEATEAPDGSVGLALASHGRRVPIARDIGSDQRRAFAVALSAALRLVREPEWPR